MDLSTLKFDVTDHVATITLDRPNNANSVNAELAMELMQVSLVCADDAEIRAVVITGGQGIFCGGGDLKDFVARGDALPRYILEVTAYLHAAISRLARMPAPLIAAVGGAAGGAGMSLVCAADMVIAAESARFTMAYTRIGMTPNGSSTYFLSRIVGLRRAMELTLTNRVLSAPEALAWGIANRVVPDSEVLEEALALARQLAAGPTVALGESKRLLHAGWTGTLETQMEEEAQTIAKVACTADAHEGIRAFLEKRRPEFLGR